MIMKLRMSVMPLARMMGHSPTTMPYMSHKKTPHEKIEKVAIERSFTFFVLYIFIT